jgi:MFS transporter, DHA1 family, multidrug resistance protein
LTGTALGFTGIVGTVLLVFLYMSCQGILHPNTTAMALSPFDRNAGAASAMIGFFQMFFGAAASALVSRFHNNTAIPMVGVMACCTGLAFTCLLLKAFASSDKVNEFQEGVTEQI